MNVNRSPWEVILDQQWAVWGVFIWRPIGSQMEIFFFTASFWLCIWASFWTEGCFRGRGLFPDHPGTVFPLSSLLRVWLFSCLWRFPERFQLGSAHWWRVSKWSVLARHAYICMYAFHCQFYASIPDKVKHSKLRNFSLSIFSAVNGWGRIFAIYSVGHRFICIDLR